MQVKESSIKDLESLTDAFHFFSQTLIHGIAACTEEIEIGIMAVPAEYDDDADVCT